MHRTDVLLVTDGEHAEGEPGHEVLDKELAKRGISSRWERWDDPHVGWGEARLVAVRSAWDYDLRPQDFLTWASTVGSHLLHGAEVFRWNIDKGYLKELRQLTPLPVVPTETAHDLLSLRAAIGSFGQAIVKPRVGAGGRGIVLARDPQSFKPVDKGPWVVQPVVQSVMSEGEISVFCFNGRPVSQLRKVASKKDYRCQEEYGGRSHLEPLAPEIAVLAADAVAATSEVVGTEIVYARIDLLRHDGVWSISEVEVTEPGLYLEEIPGNADHFADALAARLGL